MMHETERVVRQFHESWDLSDPERGMEVIADDCAFEVIADDCAFEDVARGEKQPGKAAYKADYDRWRGPFPDGVCRVENVIVSQDAEWAVVEFRNTGTHTGVLRSRLGDFAPTGKRCEVRSCA